MWSVLWLPLLLLPVVVVHASAPVLLHDMDQLTLPAHTQPGTAVYQLAGEDAESEVYYSLAQLTPGQPYLSVDSRTGTVTLVRPIDNTAPAELALVVGVEDLELPDSPSQQVTRQVTVYIEQPDGEDVDTTKPADKLPASAAGAPRFSAAVVQVRVAEDWPVGIPLPLSPSPFVVPAAEDSQLGIQLQLTDPMQQFELRPSKLGATGGSFNLLVKSADALDIEALGKQNLLLTVTATTAAGSSSMQLNLTIDDVDEFAPSFVTDELTVALPEDAVDGYELAVLEVIDRDLSSRAQSANVYAMFGEYSKYFTLDSTVPDLLRVLYAACATCAPAKLPGQFELVVRVYDHNSQFSLIKLNVERAASSNRSPLFAKSYYVSTLVEQSTQFVPLLRPQATDPDGDPITYKLVDATSLFAIDENTGIVSVEYPEFVSIEQLGTRFNVSVVAEDGVSAPSRVECIIVIEELKQSRNQPPVFSAPSYVFNVSLPHDRSTPVGQPVANDADGNVTYSLSQGGAGYFSLDATTGQLYYIGPLLKQDQQFELVVAAFDEGVAPKSAVAAVTVSVRAMGTSPAIIQPANAVTVFIDQDSAPLTPIQTFQLTDEDSNAELSIKVEQVIAYDRLGGQWTSEQGNRQLMSQFAFANESPASGSNATLTLSAAADLNALPQVLSMHVTVALADLAHPTEPAAKATVIVNIRPASVAFASPDQLVQFTDTPDVIEIPETLPVSGYVYTFATKAVPSELRPADDTVKFSVINGREWVSIDADTGVMRLAKSLASSRVPVSQIDALVGATHIGSGTSQTRQVTIKATQLNNHVPMFAEASYSGSVQEGAAAGTPVLTVTASDKDDDPIAYSLQGPDADAFTVDDNGTISSAAVFDREQAAALGLVLHAADPAGRTNSVPVRITVTDANDHAPVFNQKKYTESVTENVHLNTELVRVQATDEDSGSNAEVTYSLLNVQPEALRQALSIDPAHGIISNTRPLTGLSQPSPYRIGVVARDGGGSEASALVFLTITRTANCKPVWNNPATNQTVLYVTENQPSGKLITRLAAATNRDTLDLDCPVAYVIWDSAQQQYVGETPEFSVDETTGDLVAKVTFDREEQDRYPLTVAAASGVIYSRLPIEIRIQDEDDNRARFDIRQVQFELDEDVEVGVVVALLKAKDEDSEESGRIFYHLINDEDVPFVLNRFSGRLMIRSGLDRETRSQYTLYALASNRQNRPEPEQARQAVRDAASREDVVVIDITVNDVNDNGPRFTQSTYVAAAAANASEGTVLTHVSAHDPDGSPANRKLIAYKIASIVYHYKQHSRPFEGMLSLDSQSGALSLAQSVAEYTGGVFHVKVQSTDTLEEGNVNAANVKVYVFNSSEHLVRVVVNARPDSVTQTDTDAVLRAMSDAVNATAISTDVTYHTSSGAQTDTAKVDVWAVFVDGQDELLPATAVLHAVDTSASKQLLKRHNVDMVMAASSVSYSTGSSGLPEHSVAAVALICFACVLVIGLCCFAVILCYHRRNWLAKKQRVEQSKKQPAPPVMSESVFTPPPKLDRQRSPGRWPIEPLPTKCYEAQEFSLDVYGGGGTVRSNGTQQGVLPVYIEQPGEYDQVAAPEDTAPSRMPYAPRQLSQQSGWYDSVDSGRI